MRVEITDEVIPAAAITAAMRAGADGAVCVFDGMVRDNTRGRKTLHLDYEAYRGMALEQMRGLAGEAVTKFGIRDVALVHRLGRLVVGETSVLVVVASAHRGAAFEACRWLIDTLKKTVPIWKREQFVDGAVWADGEAFPEALGLESGRPSDEAHISESRYGAPGEVYPEALGWESGRPLDEAHISESRYGAPGGVYPEALGWGEESGRPASPQRASTLAGDPGLDEAHISESRYGAPGVGTRAETAVGARLTDSNASSRGIDLLGQAAARARVGDVEAFPDELGVGEESGRLSDEAHISESRYGAPAPGGRLSDEAHVPEAGDGVPGVGARKVEGGE